MIVRKNLKGANDMVLYHVTHELNVPSILKDGLIPMTGYLADAAWETRDAVYFFKEIDKNFYKDIDSWMKIVYPKDKQILLKVTLPDHFGEYGGLEERWDWEVVCYKRIPPEYIEKIPFPEIA